MIYKTSKDYTLVLYEDQHSPRFFKINKAILKSLFYLMPTICVLSFSAMVAGFFYLNEIVSQIKESEPGLIQELRNEKTQVIQELEEIKEINKDWEEKLLKSKTPVNAIFPIFLPIPNYQNLMPKNLIDIEDMEMQKTGNQAIIKYKIVNKKEEDSKLSGYVMMLFKNGSRIDIFPMAGGDLSESISSYQQGESFSVSRFKPVVTQFEVNNTNEKSYFLIFVFNRNGDLLFKKHYEFIGT
jgi:hypothetical protein